MIAPNKDSVQVHFQTETSMDIRAFTTFGLNVKPNTVSPIGHFGTGIKNAIAILVRHGIPITIYTDELSYEFYAKTSEFRGVEITDIKYKKRRLTKGKWKVVSHGRLPYTTELGKNWELWQAFRELESNTMDEDGVTSCLSADSSSVDGLVKSGRTIIVVEGNDFAQVYHNRADIFLPNATRYNTLTDGDGNVTALPDMEVFDVPSRYIYYRGIRVLDLNAHNYEPDAQENPIKSRYTYNLIGDTTLTEDRTLAYAFMLTSRIGKFIQTHDDEAWIKELLEVDPDKFWEGKIDFSNPSITPSKAFMDAYRSANAILPSARDYMRSYDAPPPKKERVRTPPDSIIAGLGAIRKDCMVAEDCRILDDAIHFIRTHKPKTEILF